MVINKKRLRQVLAFCFLLFFPLNNTISGQILFGSINPYLFLAIGVLLLTPDLKKKIAKYTILVVFAEIVIITLLLIDIKSQGQFGYLFIQLAYMLLLPILINVNIDKRAIVIAISLYTIEHVLGTIFPVVLPSIYKNNFLPFICKTSYCPARIAFESGMNSGITSQSSTNGCYMAIFALFHASMLIDNPNKKNIVLTILTIICLLMIGKRAHFIFTITALFFAYITKNDNFNLLNFIKKNFKIITIGVISLIGLIAISSTIPQIRTTIDRIIASKDSADITSRRGPLYGLAVEKWKESPIFGSGWGAYIAASHEKFGITTYGSDYIHAHNDYLEILCDKGLFGIIIYAAFLIWIIRSAYSTRNNGYLQKFSFTYATFYLLYGLTGTPLYIISNYVFMLAIIITIIKGKEYEKNRRDNIQ